MRLNFNNMEKQTFKKIGDKIEITTPKVEVVSYSPEEITEQLNTLEQQKLMLTQMYNKRMSELDNEIKEKKDYVKKCDELCIGQNKEIMI